MNRSRPLAPLALLSLSALVFGCTAEGGQTGEETNEPCRETRTALELTQPSPLGFSAEDMLATTGDAVHAAGSWLPVDGFAYGPESGAGSLDLALGAMRAAQFVKSEASRNAEIVLYACADRVELTLTASASTAGGALDEQFQAVLMASVADDVSLSQPFDPAKLSGQFAFDPQTLGSKRFSRLTLSGHWQGGAFAAGLAAGLEDGAGGGPNATVSFTNLPVACFSSGASGARNDCAP